MAIRGYEKKVQISTDGGTTWQDLKVREASLNKGRVQLDTTMTGDQIRRFILGLKEVEITGSLYPDYTDTAFLALRDAENNGTAIAVKYLADGTNGFQCLTCYVSRLEFGGEVDGVETVNFTIIVDADVTPVP